MQKNIELGTHICKRCDTKHYNRTQADKPASCFECDGMDFEFMSGMKEATSKKVRKTIPGILPWKKAS